MLSPELAEALPPQDLEAEASVLGACLIPPGGAFGRVERMLTAESFYRPAHGDAWTAIHALHLRQEPIDLITVRLELEKVERWRDLSAGGFLLQLVNTVPTAANVEAYAKVVRECHVRRLVMRACLGGYQAAREDESPGQTINRIVGELQGIRFGSSGPKARHIGDLLQDILAKFDISGPTLSNAGLRTGLKNLDEVFQLMRPGYLATLSGRPGEGKTTVMELISRHIAETCGPVLMWSGECPREVMGERLLAMEALVRAETIRRGPEPAFRAARSAMDGAASRLELLPLWLADESDPATQQGIDAAIGSLEATARAVVEEEGRPLSLLCIDRIELLGGNLPPDANLEMHRRATAIKQLAMRLKTVALVLAQPNENRTRDKRDRPILSDLQYGSALRQNSQAILFLDRADYELPAGQPKTGAARVWILKSNDGQTGAVPIYFRDELPAFFNSEHDYLVASRGPSTSSAPPQPVTYTETSEDYNPEELPWGR